MMRTFAFPHFRASYAIAACSVALATICAYQAPGLMQAILVVGANAQLPLERLAAQADTAEPAASAALAPAAWKERAPAQARPDAQKLDDSSGQTLRDRHARNETHGYERSVTDYKYWT